MKMESLGGRLKQVRKNDNRKREVPRGCFPVDVVGDAEKMRYAISVEFLNNDCSFARLLDEYEDEIRMHATGPITLPCSVAKFQEALCRDRVHSTIQHIQTK